MSLRSSVAVIALIAAFASSAHAYDLRGARLGLTIDELRRLKLSDAAGAQVVCHGDPEAKDLRPTPETTPTEEEERRGAISCGFYRFGKVLGDRSSSTLPPEWVSAPVRIADVPSSPVFWFVPDEGAKAPLRLFRITVRSNSLNWDKYWGDYTRRLGRPTFEKTERYSTGPHGGHLDNVIGIWDDGSTSVTLTKYDKRASQMSLQYLDKRAAWSIRDKAG